MINDNNHPRRVSIHPPAEALTVKAFGDEVTFLVTGEQSQGNYTIFHDVTPPGGGPPPHYHLNEDELFFVIEGQASFFAEGRWTPVPAGSVVYAPRGSIHSFRNDGSTPLRQLIRTSPSGFERFFTLCGEEFARPGGPDMQRVVAIAGEHGIHFIDPAQSAAA